MEVTGARGTEKIGLVVGEDPGKDRILREVIKRSICEAVEIHEIPKSNMSLN
jgi:hypothetical protein